MLLTYIHKGITTMLLLLYICNFWSNKIYESENVIFKINNNDLSVISHLIQVLKL
jgi:hypothetical protein